MPGIKVNTEKCRGCGLCARVCAAGAIKIENKKAEVNPALCTGCSMCISSCHFDALSADTGSAANPGGTIAVFAERDDSGMLCRHVFELLGKGSELAAAAAARLEVYGLGNGRLSAEEEAALLGTYGADRYVLNPDSCFDIKNEESYRDGLCDIIKAEKPAAVLFGATLFGRGTAPGVAALLRTGLTADCTGLEIDQESGNLIQTRPAFGGNLMASIVCAGTRPQMATVRPGVMQAHKDDMRGPAVLKLVKADKTYANTAEILEKALADTKSSIADAKIIIDCGRGVGSKKNLKLIGELAAKTGAAIGCTRPLVDTGMCAYSSQIGQTGTTVAPDLLITLGVSGAIQHLAGIAGAKKIIAVNSDPDAPIFASADVKIVADCIDIVKELLK